MIQKVKLISKKKFGKAALNKNIKTFIMQKISLISKITIVLAWKTQIVLMILEKNIITAQYFDFLNVFSRNQLS